MFFWHWFILAAVLFILEILVPGAYFLWGACAAVVMAVLLYLMPDMSFLPQIVIFATLSATAVLIHRNYRKKNPLTSDEPSLNRRGEYYIGRIFTLSSPIIDGVGKIKVDDALWDVRSATLRKEAGRVRVIAAEDQRLIVEVVDDAPDDNLG